MKPEVLNLFDTSPSISKPTCWLLVTNHLNILYMLAAGLIMPPSGFGKNYYSDTLSAYPGWIPLFADVVLKSALEYSSSEKSHLISCIASINLSSLHGKVMVIDSVGAAKELNFPEELDGSEQLLLVPAPLPVHWINSIYFQSRENKATCESDARDFGNVPLLDFKREISSRIFTHVRTGQWPPSSGISVPVNEVILDAPFAAGGIMGMLLHFGNIGELGMQACRLAFDAEESVAQTIPDILISKMGRWMLTGQQIESNVIPEKLFWGAVVRVASSRFSDLPSNPLEVMLGYLESVGESMDDQMKSALVKLVDDLRTIASFSDSTITEIFTRHPKVFSRVMSMFFLREKCTDLLAFKHPLLTESDYIVAAILFAARDGWLGLPLQLRNVSGSHAAISHRMAAMAHRMACTEINLGIPPHRPLPLRELFLRGPKGWNAAQKDAALKLVREHKWDGITQTRVSLGKGDYRLEVDSGGMHIVIAGEAKAVTTEVDNEKFLDALASAPISEKLESKIRDLLKNVTSSSC